MDDRPTTLTSLENFIPEWLQDIETQAVLIAGLCCVGAWVTLTWIVQIIFSILWPFVAVTLLMVFLPSWRKELAREYLPKQIAVLKHWGCQIISTINNTRTTGPAG